MSKLPLISIIMNCYNGDHYINNSVNSIINQDYSNWELIFWDNKSNDKSAEIIKS
jgi:glycosyltransferase involved in cell wall biosynthesis